MLVILTTPRRDGAFAVANTLSRDRSRARIRH
jgi:hypothetical protein